MKSACGLFVCAIALCAQTETGESMYKASCAQCHDAGVNRAPQRDTFRQMTPERVLAAMESGPMITMGQRWPAEGRRAIAEYVTGKKLGTAISTDPPASAMCAPGGADFSAGPSWTGWGSNTSNTRFQNAQMAGIAAADVPRLKVKWAFGFPGELSANGHPSYAGGRVFVGSVGGKVYSLDASTGCIHWYIDAGSQVRSAVTIAKVGSGYTAFFGDGKGTAWAVDAATGKQIWKTRVDEFPVA